MLCPSCGKQIPQDSTFCLHCGFPIPKTISISPAPKSEIPSWEHKDFVYDFPAGCMWARIGEGGYTEAGARLEFWQNYQKDILRELQKWTDQGWQPIDEVGPASIQIKTYRALRYDWFGWILFVVFTLLTFYLWGVFAYLTRPSYAEPTEFNISLRRQR
jgi:hypothetical protein